MTTNQTNPFEQGPFVQIAAFCERILRETDDVISLIRVVDTVTHAERGPDPPQEMPEFHYPLTLVVTLKSGSARGRYDLRITPELPSGETLPGQTIGIHMEGEGRGASVIIPVDIPYRLEGLHWFNLHFDDRVLTRVPLRVRYARLAAGTASSQA